MALQAALREGELRKFPKWLRGLAAPFVNLVKKNKDVTAKSNNAAADAADAADAFAALLKGRSASEEVTSALARQVYESSLQARFVSTRALVYVHFTSE